MHIFSLAGQKRGNMFMKKLQISLQNTISFFCFLFDQNNSRTLYGVPHVYIIFFIV